MMGEETKNRNISSLSLVILVLVILPVLGACAKIGPTTRIPAPPISIPPPAQTSIDMTIDLLTSWTWDAQTFTTPVNGYIIKGASVNVSKVGSPPNPLIISIRAVDSNGHPTGPDLTRGEIAASLIRQASEFTGFTNVNFSPPYALNGNTKYALVMYSRGESSENYYCWWIQRSDVFPGGNLEQSVDSGLTWTSQPYDASFSLNIRPIATVPLKQY